MATLQLGSRSPESDSVPASGSFFALIRQSRPVQAVLAAGMLVVALIALGTTLLVADLRSREIAEAKRTLLNVNGLLAESTARALESVDLVLQNVIEEIRGGDIGSTAAFEALRENRAFHESLRTRVAGLPQIAAISLVDLTGRVVSFSRGFPVPTIDLSDRDHFRTLTAGTIHGVFVSEPVQNKGNGESSVYLARQVLTPGGQMIGLAYAAIDLDHFAKSYGALALREGNSVSLWQLDGTLLIRNPPIEGTGRRFKLSTLQGLTRDSPPVVYEATNGIDGMARIVARHVLPNVPMMTITTRSIDELLAEWRKQAFLFAIAGIMLVVAALAVTIALVRQFRAYEAVLQANRERALAVRGIGELEEQLRQSQKLEVMGQLTSGVAHDFNNLLTIVIGNLDRLTRRLGGNQPDLARYIDSARSGADRAASLSQRLLAFSRRQPLEPRRLDVNNVVSGLADLLEQTLGRKAVLTIALAEGLPPIFADPSGLESALLNLVVNARDALPKGGTVTVETHAPADQASGDQTSGDIVCLSVTDTGTGMTPEVMKRAFEPFFTTKEPGLGTGLGLAQVYGFAKQSGGMVTIDSREGDGTRITFCLPAAGGSAHPQKAQP